jgi:catalase (peroxidase I)
MSVFNDLNTVKSLKAKREDIKKQERLASVAFKDRVIKADDELNKLTREFRAKREQVEKEFDAAREKLSDQSFSIGKEYEKAVEAEAKRINAISDEVARNKEANALIAIDEPLAKKYLK